jgi:hypothetical protein
MKLYEFFELDLERFQELSYEKARQELKKRYGKLAVKYHPDKVKNKTDKSQVEKAEKKYIEIQKVYKNLLKASNIKELNDAINSTIEQPADDIIIFFQMPGHDEDEKVPAFSQSCEMAASTNPQNSTRVNLTQLILNNRVSVEQVLCLAKKYRNLWLIDQLLKSSQLESHFMVEHCWQLFLTAYDIAQGKQAELRRYPALKEYLEKILTSKSHKYSLVGSLRHWCCKKNIELEHYKKLLVEQVGKDSLLSYVLFNKDLRLAKFFLENFSSSLSLIDKLKLVVVLPYDNLKQNSFFEPILNDFLNAIEKEDKVKFLNVLNVLWKDSKVTVKDVIELCDIVNKSSFTNMVVLEIFEHFSQKEIEKYFEVFNPNIRRLLISIRNKSEKLSEDEKFSLDEFIYGGENCIETDATGRFNNFEIFLIDYIVRNISDDGSDSAIYLKLSDPQFFLDESRWYKRLLELPFGRMGKQTKIAFLKNLAKNHIFFIQLLKMVKGDNESYKELINLMVEGQVLIPLGCDQEFIQQFFCSKYVINNVYDPLLKESFKTIFSFFVLNGKELIHGFSKEYLDKIFEKYLESKIDNLAFFTDENMINLGREWLKRKLLEGNLTSTELNLLLCNDLLSTKEIKDSSQKIWQAILGFSQCKFDQVRDKMLKQLFASGEHRLITQQLLTDAEKKETIITFFENNPAFLYQYLKIDTSDLTVDLLDKLQLLVLKNHDRSTVIYKIDEFCSRNLSELISLIKNYISLQYELFAAESRELSDESEISIRIINCTIRIAILSFQMKYEEVALGVFRAIAKMQGEADEKEIVSFVSECFQNDFGAQILASICNWDSKKFVNMKDFSSSYINDFLMVMAGVSGYSQQYISSGFLSRCPQAYLPVEFQSRVEKFYKLSEILNNMKRDRSLANKYMSDSVEELIELVDTAVIDEKLYEMLEKSLRIYPIFFMAILELAKFKTIKTLPTYELQNKITETLKQLATRISSATYLTYKFSAQAWLKYSPKSLSLEEKQQISNKFDLEEHKSDEVQSDVAHLFEAENIAIRVEEVEHDQIFHEFYEGFTSAIPSSDGSIDRFIHYDEALGLHLQLMQISYEALSPKHQHRWLTLKNAYPKNSPEDFLLWVINCAVKFSDTDNQSYSLLVSQLTKNGIFQHLANNGFYTDKLIALINADIKTDNKIILNFIIDELVNDFFNSIVRYQSLLSDELIKIIIDSAYEKNDSYNTVASLLCGFLAFYKDKQCEDESSTVHLLVIETTLLQLKKCKNFEEFKALALSLSDNGFFRRLSSYQEFSNKFILICKEKSCSHEESKSDCDKQVIVSELLNQISKKSFPEYLIWHYSAINTCEYSHAEEIFKLLVQGGFNEDRLIKSVTQVDVACVDDLPKVENLKKHWLKTLFKENYGNFDYYKNLLDDPDSQISGLLSLVVNSLTNLQGSLASDKGVRLFKENGNKKADIVKTEMTKLFNILKDNNVILNAQDESAVRDYIISKSANTFKQILQNKEIASVRNKAVYTFKCIAGCLLILGACASLMIFSKACRDYCASLFAVATVSKLNEMLVKVSKLQENPNTNHANVA